MDIVNAPSDRIVSIMHFRLKPVQFRLVYNIHNSMISFPSTLPLVAGLSRPSPAIGPHFTHTTPDKFVPAGMGGHAQNAWMGAGASYVNWPGFMHNYSA